MAIRAEYRGKLEEMHTAFDGVVIARIGLTEPSADAVMFVYTTNQACLEFALGDPVVFMADTLPREVDYPGVSPAITFASCQSQGLRKIDPETARSLGVV